MLIQWNKQALLGFLLFQIETIIKLFTTFYQKNTMFSDIKLYLSSYTVRPWPRFTWIKTLVVETFFSFFKFVSLKCDSLHQFCMFWEGKRKYLYASLWYKRLMDIACSKPFSLKCFNDLTKNTVKLTLFVTL